MQQGAQRGASSFPSRPRRRRLDERGASAVEFALMLPVLVLVVGAVIDFGWFFSQQIVANSAVRDASRAGVVVALGGTPQGCATITEATRIGMADSLGMAASASNVEVHIYRDAAAPSSSPLCSLASGSSSTSNPTTTPCTESPTPTTARYLRVTASAPFSPPFPVPFMGSMSITSKGVFRCEYA